MRGRLYFRPGIRQLDLFIRFRGNPTPGFLPRLLVRNFGRLPANSLTNFKFLPLRRSISASPDLRISGTQPRISSPIVRSYNVSLVRAKEKGATFFSSLSFFRKFSVSLGKNSIARSTHIARARSRNESSKDGRWKRDLEKV